MNEMELTRSSSSICSLSLGNDTGFMENDAAATSFRNFDETDDEVELQWAAIERLPTFTRLRTSLVIDQNVYGSTNNFKQQEEDGKSTATVIDVTKLVPQQKHVFISRLIQKIEQDNHHLLQKLRARISRVGLELPGVEVRFQDLSVETECEVDAIKSLPTLWNTLKKMFSATKGMIHNSSGNRIKILEDVGGIIKPSRITLLLGPPGCGKSTFLLALSGRLSKSLKVEGEISYNGYKLNEFVPQKTAAYISQYDLHISEMTVRETLDFAACCHGTGDRAEILTEVIRREKQAGIIPDPDVDTYMKAIAVEGLTRTLQTDYILKILGLDICADTIVGDAMRRGISGGQKKRLTTAEMIVGPAKVLLMDEISTGLDSSTTLQIITCLQQWAHISGSTILISLLQPAPETFNLFDDIILMAEGKIAYHGPRDEVLEFFEKCGFRCPPRKGTADFLQEVVSKKDQAQYWLHGDKPYNYFSVEEFGSAFKTFHVGQKLNDELSRPFNKSDFLKSALSFNIHSVSKLELFKVCVAREWLLMKRNSFVHVFKTLQLVVIASITMTIFIRTRMKIDVIHGNYYMGSLFYAVLRLMSNGISELSLTFSRLGVFYKQRDYYFYPTWAYSIPAAILKIPFSLIDAFLWTVLTYYVIGYSPEPQRFFQQILVLFILHQVSVSLMRFIASMFRHPSVAASCGLFAILVMSLFGGFIIQQPSLPAWLKWGFWVSPLTYAEIGVSTIEFLAPRWQKVLPSNVSIGHQVLTQRGLNYAASYYWLSIGALIGFWILFNVGFTCALSLLRTPGRSRAIISYGKQSDVIRRKSNSIKISQENKFPHINATTEAPAGVKQIGLILPFEPMAMTFKNVQYFVDTPKKIREQGFEHKKLQLLEDITGAFRPGILTALMGVSGAGKTTLMDVLSGRKTGGVIEGDIRVGGYPKVHATFARISGYCEQTDIHSPQITIKESLTYSAWLRLPSQIHPTTKYEFVAEVLQLIELDDIQDALVGLPGVSGLSNEQRKRLTIAVELVSNPSIIFMDEPTSGLDARAAAIVMRAVKNIVKTNRTVVCTIHQPSIDIFEAFDELILMKRGGQLIYSGELGVHSSELIKYFENIPGVPKIQVDRNPSTWMLEVTSQSAEVQLGVDFSTLYKRSDLYQKTKDLVRELSSPAEDSKELQFSTNFPQNGWEQFKACLWKQNISYWRSPNYNLIRLTLVTMASLLFGAILWRKGKAINKEQDLFNILGAMFIFIQFLGIGNCESVVPFVSTERTIFYRERFAGMYSSWAYSLAQVTIEIPYVFVQAVIFMTIMYPAIDFQWSVDKVLWYFYISFCTMLYFTYLGMVLVSVTPNLQVASVLASFLYTSLALFSGFLIPEPRIPKWWVWVYWISPSSWSLRGLITSQYGDIDMEINVFGKRKAIKDFLGNYFGYHHDQLGIVAFSLAAFPILFAFIFAYSLAKFNFQRS